MATVTIPFKSSISSVKALQDSVNFEEGNLPGKLQSLKAITEGGKKITNGDFEKQDDVDETGNVILKKDAKGSNTAWIRGVETNISISGS